MIGILIGALSLASCNLPVAEQTPAVSAADQLYTAAAQTVSARLTQGAVQSTPQVGQTPSPQTPQPAAVTATPTITLTTQPPVVINPTATQACDRVSFVSDVSVSDGTNFAPGAAFVKTWRLKNDGSCTWTTGYALVFDHGNAMNGPSAILLPSSVAPGQTIDISVNLVAPTAAGSYRGYWTLRNTAGLVFGLGDKGDVPFYVDIAVGGVSAVTGIYFTANPSYSGVCNPAALTFAANIAYGNAGTVTYHWTFSDASNSPTYSLNFSIAGSQAVTYTLNLTKDPGSYSGWAKIYIEDPNHQEFSQAVYTLTCNTP